MRKAVFISLSSTFVMASLVVLPLACGGSDTHPTALADPDSGTTGRPDSTTSQPPVDSGSDGSTGVDGGPTTVSITAGDGGAASAISFGDNGLVNCGSAATSMPVSIANTGSNGLTWTATLSAGAASYTLSPVSGSVGAGQTGTLQIIPNAIPATSAVTPDLYGGVITVQTSASNDSTHVIQLHQTARGVILNSTLAASLNFGAAPTAATVNSPFSLTNTGNVEATVTLAVGSQIFGVLAPDGTKTMPFVIPASGTGAPTITFDPAAVQTYADTMVTTISQPGGGAPAVCGPLPVNVTLAGAGNNTVNFSPTNIDFGSTNCNATAAPQDITLTNKGAAISFTTAFAKGANAPFTISPKTGNVAANGSQILTVTPLLVPKPSSTAADGFGDTLTITTDDGGGTQIPHNITLTQTARGAILQFAPAAISTSGPATLSQFVGFSVQNVGNYEGTFKLGGGTMQTAVTQTTNGSGTWSSNLWDGNLVGGATGSGVLTVVGPTAGQQNLGHISLTIQPNTNGDPTVLCADAPPDLELSAMGL